VKVIVTYFISIIPPGWTNWGKPNRKWMFFVFPVPLVKCHDDSSLLF